LTAGHYYAIKRHLEEVELPIYEYRCSKCGKTFEMLQSISSEPISKCIYCQGRAKKVISMSSFQLKGKGWYSTDYKKGGDAGKKGEPAVKNEKKTDKNANTN
jgi:putative FmdB family regulatory protein